MGQVVAGLGFALLVELGGVVNSLAGQEAGQDLAAGGPVLALFDPTVFAADGLGVAAIFWRIGAEDGQVGVQQQGQGPGRLVAGGVVAGGLFVTLLLLPPPQAASTKREAAEAANALRFMKQCLPVCAATHRSSGA